MANDPQRTILREVDRLLQVGRVGSLSDGHLLKLFATRGGETGETAFAVLVERHGPMVLRACRSVLRDPHEAEDAFQATFLLLAHKAGSLWVRDSLGPWLHQVALRTAAGAQSALARRRHHERRAAKPPSTPDPQESTTRDLGPVLQEEIGHLPERYRKPLVLFHLEGLTHEQVAEQLHWPVGTVRSRLARGRDRLRSRLVRRGLAPSVVSLVAALARESAAAVLPPALAETTARAATQWVAGGGVAAGTIGEVARALARRVLRLMLLTRITMGAMVLMVTLGLAAASAGWLTAQPTEDRPTTPSPPAPAARPAQRPPAPAQPKPRPLTDDQVRSLLREADRVVETTKGADAKPRMRLALARIRAYIGAREEALADLRRAIKDADTETNNLPNLDFQEPYTQVQKTQIRTLIAQRWPIYIRGSVAEEQEGLGQHEAAVETLREALELANAQKGYERDDARKALLSAQVKTGDLEGAFQTIHELKKVYTVQGLGLVQFFLNLAAKGEKPVVQEAARRVLAMADPMTDDALRSMALRAVAAGLAKVGDIEGAAKVIETLEQETARFGLQNPLGRGRWYNREKAFALAALGKALARAGERTAASNAFREAAQAAAVVGPEGESVRASDLEQIARAQIEAGDLEGATQTAHEIVSENSRVMVLALISEAQAKAGKAEAATRTLQEAIAVTRAIRPRALPPDRSSSPQPSVKRCLHLIAEAQAAMGETEDALRTVDGIQDRRDRDGAMVGVVRGLARRGEGAEARRLAATIHDPGTRVSAEWWIAFVQGETGDLADALAWAVALPDEDRTEAVRGLVDGVAQRVHDR